MYNKILRLQMRIKNAKIIVSFLFKGLRSEKINIKTRVCLSMCMCV